MRPRCDALLDSLFAAADQRSADCKARVAERQSRELRVCFVSCEPDSNTSIFVHRARRIKHVRVCASSGSLASANYSVHLRRRQRAHPFAWIHPPSKTSVVSRSETNICYTNTSDLCSLLAYPYRCRTAAPQRGDHAVLRVLHVVHGAREHVDQHPRHGAAEGPEREQNAAGHGARCKYGELLD